MPDIKFLPVPNWLQLQWKNAKKNGLDKISLREINKEIHLTRYTMVTI